MFSLGNQIGVGKESDIYVVASESGRQCVLKLHRLGRISFRTVKANRDYLRNRSTGSWMYLSRLAAMKEYAFMQVLRREGFRVPEPLGQSRHTIVMEFIDAFPLRQIDSVPDPAPLYAELMDNIVRLARFGLIHGDFNEFNILVREIAGPGGRINLVPVIIDFPQMLSITHANAKYYFDRDVECIRRFFSRRFKFESDEPGPHFVDAIKDSDKAKRLDVEVEATGFNRKMAKDLDKYIEAVGLEETNDTGEDVTPVDERADESEDDEGAKDPDCAEDNTTIAGFETSDGGELDRAGLLHPPAFDLHNSDFTFEPLGFDDAASMMGVRPSTTKKASGWAI